jgi:hypothetical protein
MLPRAITALFFCMVLPLTQLTALAFETDQYNLPPVPLADLGDDLSLFVEQRLGQAITKLNKEIQAHQKCLANELGARGCASPDQERTRLTFLRSSEAMVQAAHARLGYGLPPFTRSGIWLETHKFKSKRVRFKTNYFDSIFAVNPIDYLTISSTINVYGSQFGTDKIDHLFETGYSYYQVFAKAVAGGATADEATQKAISWGQSTERSYFGTLVSGVYSNADLAANYAGMKFYQGLAHEIIIGGTTQPALLTLKDGLWEFVEQLGPRDALLKPFISNHFNEALNPSVFANHFGLRAYVRHTVKRECCAQWFKQNPNLSRTGLDNETLALRSWNGEDYGFTISEHFVTIANTCF